MIKNVAIVGGEFVGKTSLLSYLINSSNKDYEKEKSSIQLSKKIDDFFGNRIDNECLFLSTTFKNTKFNFFDTKYEKNIQLNFYKKLHHCDSVIFVIDIRNNSIADIYNTLTLIYILGIKNIVFAFNKIDLYSFSESKNRFTKLRKSILEVLKQIGIKKNHVYFVPISAYLGDNIRKITNLKWYENYLKNVNLTKDKGCLLDLINIEDKKVDSNNKFTNSGVITKIYESNLKYNIFTGISQKEINKNSQLYLQPGNKQINLKLLQSDHSDKDIVKPKENFAFTIKEEVDIDNEKLYAITNKEFKGFNKFICKICCKNIPKIKTNTNLKLNFENDCNIIKIFSILDKDENNILKENTSIIEQHQTAIILLETKEPIYLEVFDKSSKMGRVILQNNNNEIVAYGIVKSIKN